MRVKRLFLGIILLMGIADMSAVNSASENTSAFISLKAPGNEAKQYPLILQEAQDGIYNCQANEELPLLITRKAVSYTHLTLPTT